MSAHPRSTTFPIGFSSLACPAYDIDQLIALAADNGYQGVELRFVSGEVDLTVLPEFAPDSIGATRQRFADQGIEVVCVDTSVRMNTLDEAARRDQLASAKRNTAIAVGLGAPYIRVFGGPIPADGDREQLVDGIATGLGEVAEITADHGVTTLLETHDDFSTSASVLDLWDRGASPRLEVLWDALHTHRHGETPEHTWSQLGHAIRHVHLKDSWTATSAGFDFAPTGEGTVPLAEVLDVLHTGDYAGFVHFEWEKAWHPEIDDADVAVPAFARWMRDEHARRSSR